MIFIKLIPLHLLCCTIASGIIKLPVSFISKYIMKLLYKITDRKSGKNDDEGMEVVVIEPVEQKEMVSVE